MHNQSDPVDQALKSLGGQQWPGEHHNNELEERLMQHTDSTNGTRWNRPRLVAAGLAVLVLGSAGFAAAGGVDVVRSWFVTVEVNGNVVEVRGVLPEKDGSTTFVLPLPDLPESEDGDEVTVTIDAIEAEGLDAGDGNGEMRTINVVLEGSDATIEVTSDDEFGLERKPRDTSDDGEGESSDDEQ